LLLYDYVPYGFPSPSPLLRMLPGMLLNVHGHGFCGVIPQDVDDLDHDGVESWFIVLVERPQEYLWLLFCAIGLPLVMEGVVTIVPVHGPIINPLTPMRDHITHIFGNIVWWDKKVLELNGS